MKLFRFLLFYPLFSPVPILHDKWTFYKDSLHARRYFSIATIPQQNMWSSFQGWMTKEIPSISFLIKLSSFIKKQLLIYLFHFRLHEKKSELKSHKSKKKIVIFREPSTNSIPVICRTFRSDSSIYSFFLPREPFFMLVLSSTQLLI